ncbi:MAG: hypothetical protein WA208_02710 [Thermoanaerobaculia bacterium]
MSIGRALFVVAVVIGWLAVIAAKDIVTIDDATTTEAMVPHFMAWLLVMVVVSTASFTPEWRFAGRSWQKVVFWLGPSLVVADVVFHWTIFGVLSTRYRDLTALERLFVTSTYLAAGPLVLAILVALLTQLAKRDNAAKS